MLPHAILLLLGSLAVAESARPCDTSLIYGVTFQEVRFDFSDPTAQLRVTCASDLFFIQLSQDGFLANLYDSLTCDASNGWMVNINNAYPLGKSRTKKITNASSPVNISCVDLTHCDPSLIKRSNADKMEFSISTGTYSKLLQCAPPHPTRLEGILLRDGGREERYGRLRCDTQGWTANGFDGRRGGGSYRKFGKIIPSNLTISCFEYCAVLWENSGDIKMNIDTEHYDAVRYFECADESHQLFFNGVPVYDKSCTMHTGWSRNNDTRDTVPGNSPFRPQHLECRSGPTQGGKRSARAMRIAEGNQEE